MSDTAGSEPAAGGALGAPWQRVTLFLLLQLVTFLACLWLFDQSPPTPPDEYAISTASLYEGGRSETVQLPHVLDSNFTMAAPPEFEASFEYRPDAASTPWSIMLPRLGNAVEVAINGQIVLDTRLDPEINWHLNNMPVMAAIPNAILRSGTNAISIRLYVWGPLRGYLDRVYVGPTNQLRPAYGLRSFLFATLPLIFKSWKAILAVILGIMWLNRRHELAYGMLAGAMVLGVVQGLTTTPILGSLQSRFTVLMGAATPLETALLFVFLTLFFREPLPRWTPLLFVPSLAMIVSALLANFWLLRWIYVLLAMPVGCVMLILSLALVARRALRTGSSVTMIMSCALTIVLTCWVYDMLVAADIIQHGRIFLARMSISFLLVAIGAALTWRFAHALNEVDAFATRMIDLVGEAEEKVRASFAREEERSRAIALATERSRLMRDLHDGLGGQLMSIVALSERDAQGARINQAARAALRELRLVIDAMDDMGGDLLLALGSWRERAQSQLRSHGLRLEWQAEQHGMPLHPELRPWHVIQIVRILDEAITNAARHSGGTRVLVRLGSAPEVGEAAPESPGGGWIRVSDNGHGMSPRPYPPAMPREKRGLANMQARAAMCGAWLDIFSDSAGTSIRLALPATLPEQPLSELTAG